MVARTRTPRRCTWGNRQSLFFSDRFLLVTGSRADPQRLVLFTDWSTRLDSNQFLYPRGGGPWPVGHPPARQRITPLAEGVLPMDDTYLFRPATDPIIMIIMIIMIVMNAGDEIRTRNFLLGKQAL